MIGGAGFQVVAADPPWMYQKRPGIKGDGVGASGIAEAIYPTMTNEEIAAVPVRDAVAADAHLFLWVTNPGIYGGRFSTITPAEIAVSWGFTYRTLITWVKTVSHGRPDRGGMGWYFRGATEHMLYATRGKAGIPPALREPNVLLAAKGPHSRKPAGAYDLIERVTPGTKRLELFARGPRPGWSTWGNQSDGSPVHTDARPTILEDTLFGPERVTPQ